MGAASGTSTPHPVVQTLNNQFDENASYVRRYASRLEKEVVTPAVAFSQSSFEKRPLTSLLLAIFSLLSAIPVLLFIVAVLSTTLSLISIAIGVALLASFTVSLGFFSILATTLTGTFIASLLLTAGAIAIFLTSKLVFLAWSDGQEGVYEWAGQTKEQLSYTFGHRSAKHEPQSSSTFDHSPQFHDSGVGFTLEDFGRQHADETNSGFTTDSELKVEG